MLLRDTKYLSVKPLLFAFSLFLVALSSDTSWRQTRGARPTRQKFVRLSYTTRHDDDDADCYLDERKKCRFSHPCARWKPFLISAFGYKPTGPPHTTHNTPHNPTFGEREQGVGGTTRWGKEGVDGLSQKPLAAAQPQRITLVEFSSPPAEQTNKHRTQKMQPSTFKTKL